MFQGLRYLVGRVTDHSDPLLAKVVRNLSQWTFNEQRAIAKATERVEAIKEQRTRARRAEKAIERLAAGGGEEKSDDEDEEDNLTFSDLPPIPTYQHRRLWGEHVEPLIGEQQRVTKRRASGIVSYAVNTPSHTTGYTRRSLRYGVPEPGLAG